MTTQHLLLVENEPAILHILQAALEFGGYSTEVAGDALACLQLLKSRSFDAMLLDLGLPDIDGARLIEVVRTAGHHFPILAIAHPSEDRRKIEVLDAGADDFIEKPFYPGELLARIRAALRRNPPAPVQRTGARARR